MSWLRDMPIRRKLTLVILLVSTASLVLACVAFVRYEVFATREAMVRDLTAMADVVGQNTTAALKFDDAATAKKTLLTLQAKPHLVVACLFKQNGQRFAEYARPGAQPEFPAQPDKDGSQFKSDWLELFRPVRLNEKMIGTIYLRSDLGAIHERLRSFAKIAGMVLAASMALAIAISFWLQQLVSRPILALADTAKVIKENKDYSIRAKKAGHNEIGLLTDSFNQMLTQIDTQDRAVRAGEAYLRAILESALDCIITMNHKGEIVEFNPAAEKMFGHRRSQAIGGQLADLIIPKSLREKHRDGLARYRATGEAPVLGKRLELMAMRSDGSEFPVELAITQVAQEGLPMFTGFIRDITERKDAERVVSRLAAIVESSEDAIISKDLNGVILSWNKGAEKLFGYSAAEAIGRPITFLLPPERHAEGFDILEKIKSGRRVEHYETVRMRKDKSLIDVSVSISPIRDASGRIVAVSKIARDNTERKRAEDEIQKLNQDLERRVVERTAQLESANKEMEAFSYSVSHDLRAPLRSIDGFSQALLEDYSGKLDEDGRNHLQRVRAATQRMGQLIDDLLNLSRLSRTELRSEPVDLTSLAQSVVAELRERDPKRQVELQIAKGLVAHGDPRLLRVVLENLLGNAWKFTSKQPHATIEFSSAGQNGTREFFVRDNGAGFDMAYADKLFGAFQRLHSAEEFSGTGIGLATVQRIIHRHGGRIWAQSAVNQGATFHFTLS
jgi:PAS domain S-box-containing protein